MAAGLEASGSSPESSQVFSPKSERSGGMEFGVCSLVLLFAFLFFSHRSLLSTPIPVPQPLPFLCILGWCQRPTWCGR